ncbi:MAG: [acyl-carrier-protein] S-malonyltransferase [Candidatus Eremiobacter antarcticus]|nr:MAG: [acyl-carrier-protein] S-malonyltransferase [Candidatus Eremiobacter sp. RRmetagenome_bin22]
MGADVAARYPASQACFDQASEVLGFDLLASCSTATPETLRETRLSQPAIFTANVAIYRAVETLGMTPVVSAGHSFGEYCSLTIAGALAFDEAVRIVNERGQAMGEAADAAPGTMAAIIGFDEARVDDICARVRESSGGHVEIGNLNTPEQIVISGDIAAVTAACELAKAEGVKRVRVLNVSGAWHSSLMQSAALRFGAAVRTAELHMPSFTVVSNVTGAPYASVEAMRASLLASLCSRVRWHETALAVAAMGADAIVECGASEVLAPMMKRLPALKETQVMHVADSGGVAKLEAAVLARQAHLVD